MRRRNIAINFFQNVPGVFARPGSCLWQGRAQITKNRPVTPLQQPARPPTISSLVEIDPHRRQCSGQNAICRSQEPGSPLPSGANWRELCRHWVEMNRFSAQRSSPEAWTSSPMLQADRASPGSSVRECLVTSRRSREDRSEPKLAVSSSKRTSRNQLFNRYYFGS